MSCSLLSFDVWLKLLSILFLEDPTQPGQLC